MMKYSFLLHFILLSFPLFSQGASGVQEVPLTFEDLPKLLEAHNGSLKGATLLKQSSNELTGHLGRSFLPAIELRLGHEETSGNPYNKNENGYEYGQIQAQINLFRGGRDALEEAKRQAQDKLQMVKVNQVKFDLLTQIRSLYWHYLYQKEVISTLELALELNERNLLAASKRISGGIATPTDKLEFTQTRIQFKQDLEVAKIELENITRTLASLLGLGSDVKFLTSKLVPHDHQIETGLLLSSFTQSSHRDYQALNLQEEITALSKKKSSRWWTPELDLYAAKGQKFERISRGNEQDFDDGDVIGLKLTFQFDKWQDQVQSTSLAYQELANQEQKKQLANELRAKFQNALRLYELNHQLIHSSEENIKESEKYLKNTRDEYARGVKNSPDVLQASQRLVNAKLRYAQIKKDYQVARSVIMGLLEI